METVQQNGRFTLFSSKFLSIYSILYVYTPEHSPELTRTTFVFFTLNSIAFLSLIQQSLSKQILLFPSADKKSLFKNKNYTFKWANCDGTEHLSGKSA